MPLTPEQLFDLEALIDKSSLRQVVSALVQISYEKGQHIRENWQDRATASLWHQAGNELERVEEKLKSRNAIVRAEAAIQSARDSVQPLQDLSDELARDAP